MSYLERLEKGLLILHTISHASIAEEDQANMTMSGDTDGR